MWVCTQSVCVICLVSILISFDWGKTYFLRIRSCKKWRKKTCQGDEMLVCWFVVFQEAEKDACVGCVQSKLLAGTELFSTMHLFLYASSWGLCALISPPAIIRRKLSIWTPYTAAVVDMVYLGIQEPANTKTMMMMMMVASSCTDVPNGYINVLS